MTLNHAKIKNNKIRENKKNIKIKKIIKYKNKKNIKIKIILIK